jgi:hypothetical protein
MGKVTSGKELLAVSTLCLLFYKQLSSVCEDGEEIFLRLRLILASTTTIVVSGKRRRPISFSTLLVTSPRHGNYCIFVVIVLASVGFVVDAFALLSSLPLSVFFFVCDNLAFSLRQFGVLAVTCRVIPGATSFCVRRPPYEKRENMTTSKNHTSQNPVLESIQI